MTRDGIGHSKQRESGNKGSGNNAMGGEGTTA